MFRVVALNMPDELHRHVVDVIILQLVEECLIGPQLFCFIPALLHTEESAHCVQNNLGPWRWRSQVNKLGDIRWLNTLDSADCLRFDLLEFQLGFLIGHK